MRKFNWDDIDIFGGCFSTPFRVINGVPQGRILSPSFFNLYMDGLSLRLNCTRLGCSMYDRLINHLFYADDAVILATSPYVLQKLLDICAQYADEFELSFNVKKTKCLNFLPKCFKDFKVPRFYLSGVNIYIVIDI